MLQTLLSLYLGLSGKPAKRTSPRRRPAFSRPSCRPRLETLEDRCTPSAGALDPTFGHGAGYVTTSLTGSRDTAYSVLIQPDGKILATGDASATSEKRIITVTHNVGLVRYNADGSLDTSFGSGGEVLGPPSTSLGYEVGALYPITGSPNDGKILVGGLAGGFSIARFDANGTLDPSFGSNGVATANFGATLGTVGAFYTVIQSDGKIVALGEASYTNGGTGASELARFNADGSLDTSFGQAGLVVGQEPNPWQLLLQPNGKLIVVGENSLNGNPGMQLARYNPDGSLDTSFGTNGTVSTAAGDMSYAAALYPVSGTANDGKIVVVGDRGSTVWELTRFNTDGSLDSTFGSGGQATTQLGGGTSSVAIAADGKIVVAGSNGHTFAIGRYNAGGSLDPTFGTGGIVTTSVGLASRAYAVALQPNGGIVAAGYANANDLVTHSFLVARYLPQATSPYFVITGPTSLTAGTVATYTIAVLNPDGSADTGYTGTVHITSSDPKAVLPANFTISGSTRSFSAILKTAGLQSLAATDTVTSNTTGSDGGIQVTPAAASRLVVSGFPTSITQGTAGTFTVTAIDAYGNIATGYTGTVKFSSNDPLASLPGSYTFTTADAGVHTFGLTLNTVGTESLTATDILTASTTGTETGIVVNKKKRS